MKIIKSKEEVEIFKLEKDEANKGCDKCPCCGAETYTSIETLQTKGLFRLTIYTISKYSCRFCGAEWESEPYWKGKWL